MKHYLSLFAALLSMPLFAVTHELTPTDPVVLDGFKFNSYNGKALQDDSRLTLDGNPVGKTPTMVLNAAESFKIFSIRFIVHWSLGKELDRMVKVYASPDGKKYSEVAISAADRDVALGGGYRALTFKGVCAQPARHLKIEVAQMPKDRWAFSIGAVTLAPMPNAAVFQRPLKIAFDAKMPAFLDGLRPETYNNARLELNSPRLTIDTAKPATNALIRLDMTNFEGTDAFKALKLQVLVQRSAYNGKIDQYILAEASNDGRAWRKLTLQPTGTPRKCPGGYEVADFAATADEPSRFLRIALDRNTIKAHWHCQLAGLTLFVNGEAPAAVQTQPPPVEDRAYTVFTAPQPMAGAIIELEAHNSGLKTLKCDLLADGAPLRFREKNLSSRPGGWNLRAIEAWSEKPFKELKIAFRDAPGWSVKLKEVKWEPDHAQYLNRLRSQIPDYRVRNGVPARVETFAGEFIYSTDRKPDDVLRKNTWSIGTLPRESKQAPGKKTPGLFAEPGKEITGILYRFPVTADFDPAKEKLRLNLEQSFLITTVYVDGKKIAASTEGFLPIQFDLSQAVTPGKKSEITITTLDSKAADDKDGKRLYPIGAMGVFFCGIATAPELKVESKSTPRDLFVSPRDGEVTLSFAKPEKPGYTARFVISELNGKELLSETAQTNHCKFNVDGKLKRWDVGEPNLYNAHVELSYPGETAVSDKVRFGYRTITIDKDNLLLNGRKIRLIGPWSHVGEWTFGSPVPNRSATTKELYTGLMTLGMNSGRLHCQPYLKPFYDAADETGFLIIAESALAHRPMNAAAARHVETFIKSLRNHPSIVVWSGSNEFEHWITPRREQTMTFLRDLRNRIRELDPTRPVQHSGFGDAWGELDIYNLHYPAENNNNAYPRNLYWFDNPSLFLSKLYVDNFTRFNPIGKKPIGYGEEYIPMPAEPNAQRMRNDESHLFGEKALATQYNGSPESRTLRQWMVARNWRLRVRAEREQNVMIIAPNVFGFPLNSEFVRELSRELRPFGVYPKLFAPSFPGGERTITFIGFEDTGRDAQTRVNISLELPNRDRIPLANLPLTLKGGAVAELAVKLPMPKLNTAAELLTETFDAAGKLIYTDRTPVLLTAHSLPKLNQRIALWGKSAALEKFLGELGLTVEPFSGFDSIRSKVLLVAPEISGATLQKNAKNLNHFAAQGNRIILWEREYPNGILPSDATINNGPEYGGCIGFVRDAGHPVMKGVNDLDLRFYNPDFTISASAANKPERGNFRILVDGGGGLNLAYLWEIVHGKGLYLVNHLELIRHLDRLPQARLIAARLLQYALEAPESDFTGGTVMSGNADFSAGVLADLGFNAGKADSKVLLVTGEAVKTLGVAEVAKKARQYPRVVLFNIALADVKPLARELTGAEPDVVARAVDGGCHFFADGNELYPGMTSNDLNWLNKVQLPYQFRSSEHFQTRIAPGADAIWRRDGREVRFLNLPLNRDAQNVQAQARFLSLLGTGLGCKLENQPVKNLDPEAMKFQSVPLADVANCKISDHFEIKGAVDSKFAGIPFAFGRQGNNMIRMNANTNADPKNLKYDTPVDRFEVKTPDRIQLKLPASQADALYFLHATNRNWKLRAKGSSVGAYQVNFSDGSFIRIPVTLQTNVADCRQQNEIPKAKLIGLWPMPRNGAGENASVYLVQWENPTPEKKIRNIEIINHHNPPHDLMVFGVTLRKTEKEFQ